MTKNHKHSARFLLTLLVPLLLLTMSGACRTGVSPTIPSPTPFASPAAPRPVDFVDAVSSGAVQYNLKGKGSFSGVALYPTNQSEALQINVEVGTTFVATDFDMQLLVFKKAQVTVQPHLFAMVELVVTSLDIHQLPTVNIGTAWTVHKSTRLTQFVQCTVDTLEKKRKSSEPHAKMFSERDSFVLQYAVWHARGAGREEFMDFWLHRVKMPQSHAEVNLAVFYPILEEIKQTCGALTDLKLDRSDF